MASLESSAVTINRSWTEGGTNGRLWSCRDVTLVLTGQGGGTNTIPASVLNFSEVLEAGMFVKSDDALAVLAAPSYDGSKLFLFNLAQATDADRDDPADITGTFRGVVKGFPT